VLAGVAALSLLSICKPDSLPAAGLGPAALARGDGHAVSRDGARLLVPAHFRRSTSYYCYPRNYWWFYRPYTTADQGYQRCMPYFHYAPAPPSGRADRVWK